MFNNFANESARVVYLKGGPESGKSTISKFLGNYLEERHKVSYVKYFNMERVSSVAVFSSRVEMIGSNYEGKQVSNLLPVLVILDNLDCLLKTQFEKFRSKIQEII